MTHITRPTSNEHNSYYNAYISLVPDGQIWAELNAQPATLRAMLKHVSAQHAIARPAPSEWSINEVIGHLIDAERLFSFRAFHVSRGDTAPLPSFDQDMYVPAGEYNTRTLSDLLDEFEAARISSIHLVKHLTDDMLVRIGTASGYAVSTRALVYMLAGHVTYHIISLRDSYGVR
jgi:hypothetical protein